MMMKYSAIVLLGGSSKRFNGDGINKVYLEINHKPLFLYSVEAFLNDNDCEEVIVVYNKNDYDVLCKYVNDARIKKIEGGEERYKSVLNGLKEVKSTYVLVHDGARPLINQELITKVKQALTSADCVSLGLPVSDTIKQITDTGLSTIDRESLYQVQTPQTSVTSKLFDVLSKVKATDSITDDLMAFEKYSSVKPLIVLGDKKNIKITTVEDYEYVKYLMGKRNV